jgi:hypothetical protein
MAALPTGSHTPHPRKLPAAKILGIKAEKMCTRYSIVLPRGKQSERENRRVGDR